MSSIARTGEAMMKPGVRSPRVVGLVGAVSLAALLAGCGPASPPAEPSRGPMHEVAFHAIKTNAPSMLDGIVMSAEDFLALGRLEARAAGQPFDASTLEPRAAATARHAREEARESLAEVRAEAARQGFGWASARLERSTLRDGPYDPATTRPHLDVFLHLVSRGKTLVIKLDDCFYVNGHRRLADGFSVAR